MGYREHKGSGKSGTNNNIINNSISKSE